MNGPLEFRYGGVPGVAGTALRVRLKSGTERPFERKVKYKNQGLLRDIGSKEASGSGSDC